MRSYRGIRWTALIGIHLLLWCVLSLYGRTDAAPQKGQLPFSNSVQQRNEIIRELKQVNGSLREQNTLLRKMLAEITRHGTSPPTPR